jgi:hypothetical protein
MFFFLQSSTNEKLCIPRNRFELRDSVGGITNRYGLDGPGIVSQS